MINKVTPVPAVSINKKSATVISNNTVKDIISSSISFEGMLLYDIITNGLKDNTPSINVAVQLVAATNGNKEKTAAYIDIMLHEYSETIKESVSLHAYLDPVVISYYNSLVNLKLFV